METESPHCTTEKTSRCPTSTNPLTNTTQSPERAAVPQGEERICQFTETILIPSQPINSTECESSGDPSNFLAGGSERELSPAQKTSIPKAKLVIPESLLYSGVDGSPYDLDSLPVPLPAKGCVIEENCPVDVQKHFGTPKSSERSDNLETAASVNVLNTPFLTASGASSNPPDSPAPEAQDGTPGQTGWTQDGVFVPLYSRKEKSLGLLCDK